jgi:hypothetical protein
MPIIEEIIEDIPAVAPTEVPEPTPRAATPEAPDANNESGDFVFVSRGASPAEGQRWVCSGCALCFFLIFFFQSFMNRLILTFFFFFF